MQRHVVFIVGFAAILGCRPSSPDPVRTAFAAASQDVSLGTPVAFRFPASQGARPRLYRLPSFEEISWRFEAGTSPTRSVVGFAGDQDLIYLVTEANELAGFDLTSGRVYVVDQDVALATMSPAGTPLVVRRDGSIASIRNRTATVWKNALSAPPSAIWGASRDRLLVLSPSTDSTDEGRPSLRLLSNGQAAVFQLIPEGPVRVAAWGDVAAVAVDSGVVLIDPEDSSAQALLRFSSAPTVVLFSPSAHRVFVATEDGRLHAVERYSQDVVSRLQLPGRAVDGWMGTWGRHLLLRPEDGDSIWTVDVVEWQLGPTIAASWGDTAFHLMAPDGTLLVRRGNQIVSLVSDSLAPAGDADDPRGDQWMVTAWNPRRPMLEAAASGPSQRPSTAERTIYVQVSSTSNPDWADHLAGNLGRAGMEASVLPPGGPDEPYRVVLGPYATHDEAEQTGRRLGLPFWIYTRDTQRTLP